MTIGEALAEARYRAGLTVDDVSERTKIREAVIRCIEQDDYAACGGDLYVRGYVRAIAGAVGIDAQPLIREYDAGRAAAAAATTATGARGATVTAGTFAQVPVGTAVAATAPEPATVIDLPPVPADPPFTTADLAAEPADLVATIADPGFILGDQEFTAADPDPATDPPVTQATAAPESLFAADPDPATDPPVTQATAAPEPLFAADPDPATDLPVTQATGAPEPLFAAHVPAAAYQPVPAAAYQPVPAASLSSVFDSKAAPAAQPREPSVWRARIRGRRWVSGIAVLVVIALAVAGIAGTNIVAKLRHHNTAASAAAAQQQAVGQGARAAGAKSAGSTGNTASAKNPGTGQPLKASHPAPARSLPVKRAMAFGPDGTADGDNPQTAGYAITSGSPSPWQTDWYTTANFGLLKKGTGLLLDMGATVTITSVRIDLSPYKGADLQLRMGGSPSLPDLRVAASAGDAGGTVRLTLRSPLRARYLLIWFTLLPPDGAGTYRESVYRVVVNGRP